MTSLYGVESAGFEHPQALFLALLVPLFFVLRKTGSLCRPAVPLTMADWQGSAFVWKSSVSRIVTFFTLLFANAAFLLSVIALASPIATRTEKVFTTRGTDILFVLDTSPSMASRDIVRETRNTDSRFDAAKKIITSLAQNNIGQLGLVAFASEAALTVPVTVDREFFLQRLSELAIGELGDASSLGTGIALAVYHLTSTGAPRKCIVLFTDGESNAGYIHPLTGARLANEHNISLYVVGIGTKGRVPLEYVDPKSGETYSGYFDSQFDEHALMEISSEGDGLYFAVTTLRELELSLTTVVEREQTTQVFYIKRTDVPYYESFIIAASLCAVFAWVLKRVILQEAL
jgi:Ca-activated chloride channel family protein